ncbi:MAG: NAD(P)/FAD-dependent oxidoreductase [Lachnospiraceae bacterium]|nr:NAD(P)/FAD-dependent oxidoreductase [Lachnospiraceae bacterium]
MSEVIIIGAGAAGMMAAALLGQSGHKVTVLEQNERLGKKLYITGKGRCNFTNDCDRQVFFTNVVSNPRFLYSAFDSMTPQDVINLFEGWGMATKVERGNRAFPASDKSSDVIDTLRDGMRKSKVRVMLHTKVTEIVVEDGKAAGVRAHEVRPGRDARDLDVWADCVIVATGGLSYRSTGATGDGYAFAKNCGHSVIPCIPSLVPINCKGDICPRLQGLSLRNVMLTIKKGKKVFFSEFGEMLFTHFGVSGPLVLTASAKIGRLISEHGGADLEVSIDLKPAVSKDLLEARLIKLFHSSGKKAARNVISEMFPSKMLPVMLDLCGIDPDGRACDITKSDREKLIRMTKQFPLSFESLRGYNEAVITHGGVSVKEINPRTMESKKVRGLYFIGEVLDLDALTGGFNLQIAWSTAAAAARAISDNFG